MQLLRATAFNIIMFGGGALLSLYGVLLGRYLPGGALAVAKTWARVSLWGLRVFCNITLEIEGLEYLPEGGAVIAAQHQSALDVLIWLVIIPRPAFVFKRELRRLPMFGDLLEPAGMIPVDRGGGGVALRSMVAGASAAAAGRQVVIFPEGTRAVYGVRTPIRNGIVALAQNVTVPVLPAATNTGIRWARKDFTKSPGPVHVTVFPALPPGADREEIIGQLESVFYGDRSRAPVPPAA